MFDFTRLASRRGFLGNAGRVSLLSLLPAPAAAMSALPDGDFDLSWTKQLDKATDRAIIDAPGPSDFPLQLATRILDNCDEAYGVGKHRARVVLNVRTRAIPMVLNDVLWEKYRLGREYNIRERALEEGRETIAVAVKNPFLAVPKGQPREAGAIPDLVARQTIVLACNFALGHLATTLARRVNGNRDAVMQELREGLVPGAFLVPSGMFGLTKAQNLGCAYIPGGA